MPTGLLFSGQGAQRVGMGRGFYENAPLARALYDRADAILGWEVSALSFNGPDAQLTQTQVCQPALYVVGFAAYTLLRDRMPDADFGTALGLSLGELTALAAAEAFDFETGLRIVAERGRLMQEACEQTDGAMASLIGGLPEEVAELCAAHDIDVANLNCPGQTVISGERTQVERAVEAARASGAYKRVVLLNVAGAYHSRLMEPARDRFGAFLSGVEIREPTIPVFSNTHADRVRTPDEIRDALTRQVVSPVRWEDCMRRASELGINAFYECGPGGVLAGLAKRIDRTWEVRSVADPGDLPESGTDN